MKKKKSQEFLQSEFNTKYIQLDVVLSTTNHFTMKQLNMKCSLFL